MTHERLRLRNGNKSKEDMMSRMVPTIAMILGMSIWVAPGFAALTPQLEPLSFLLGEWVPAGNSHSGESQGSATFAPSLQGRVLLRNSRADYPASAPAPASRHDDLMVIYAAEDRTIRADYYDNEGHVIRYIVHVTGPGQATFVSGIATGSPRYRLSYVLKPDGVLHGEFEIAPPGKPEAFARYLAWDSRKAPGRGGRGRASERPRRDENNLIAARRSCAARPAGPAVGARVGLEAHPPRSVAAQPSHASSRARHSVRD
jgi:hypothetical protein